ncbi:hypothetical protein CMT42_06075 [Elizabethkingia anophelis]|uniref:Uncharacterized protein n=1 Tax=Elizabethkingia anophelis TaxID=1117645 RepID=A0A1T3HHJ6_9FLAO|nr:hypothetical protein [Elizabethkingia anophelis]AQW98630.1 hypothetical protein BBD31_12300 [Elizabethkingia anophelis]AQX50893.1 hypothetical protein AYC66_09450 [Elizabethkingia anophelis]AQX89176.1 hypothetical protein AYC67_09120 [Elizabethkingia anophelis]ASV78506.1 hypothetical protein A6J37_07665 [Elizabethkingia anophelis]EKX6408276.1 hypothetical protein [Elizabethkingia anophelis]
MEDYFDLPVQYNNEELLFRVRLITYTYGYKFYICVDKQELIFENDDEGDIRVVAPCHIPGFSINRSLVETIIKVLESHRPE